MTRTVYTSVTPLPAGVTRKIVLDTLHNHVEMIDLNPLVEKRELMPKPPGKATAEEYHLTWYEMVDRISYLPGVKGRVTYHGCFHDLEDGLQTHVYAPMGLEIKDRWSVGGNEPGEPRQPVPFGINAPKDGLYLREDVDLSVNKMMISFVKKNLVNSHKVLVDRMIEKAKIIDTRRYNESIRKDISVSESPSSHSSSPSTISYPVRPALDQRFSQASQASQGYTSPSQVYDERYGSNAQGWNEANSGPARPQDNHSGLSSDQKRLHPTYQNSASNPGTQVPSQDQSASAHIQELPTDQHKDPVELE